MKYLFLILFLPAFMFANFKYFPKLYELKTKYFDIIYSENSRETAFYIASFADESYEEIQSKLNSKHKERFRVVISGDVEEANGYASLTPSYTVIAIYNALPPIDSTVANTKEFFKREFLHELTHAISLNIRNDVMEFGTKIFGNWLYTASSMPLSMIEGITVSFESLDGTGRVNYPLIRQQIQQDIHEKKARTPSQANGSYDGYLARQNFYHYGGFFSHYLQTKYGMEKYVKFWKATLESPIAGIGSPIFINSSLWAFAVSIDELKPFAMHPPLLIENVFVYPLAFYSTYGRSIDEEWKDFLKYMEYKKPLLENTNTLIEKGFLIEYPVIANDKLYFIDHGDEGIVELDLKTKKYNYLYKGEGINSIAVSEDGKYLTVCRTHYFDRKNEILKIYARKFDISKRSFVDKKIESVREVSFFGENLIGIKLRKHFTDLVLIDKNGKIETLLKGNENTIFGTPYKLNDSEIVFLLNYKGKMQIGKLNIKTKELFTLQTDIRFLRNLSIYENKIFFSYNNGEGFYKAAYCEKDNLYLDERDFSGGAFYPLYQNKNIYYVGKFADEDRFLILPDQEKLKQLPTKWEKITLEEDRNQEYIATFSQKEKKYNPFFDMLPHAWIPYISFQGESFERGIDGFGLMMYITDPYRFNTIKITGIYNTIMNFPNLNISWESSMLPLHFSLTGYDELKYDLDFNDYLRYTGGIFDIWYTFNSDSPNKYLTIGEKINYNQTQLDIKYFFNQGRIHPYEWDFTYTRYLIFTTYSKLAFYSMYHPYRLYDSMRGFELNLYFDYYKTLTNDMGIDTNSYKIEAMIEYYPYVLPIVVNIYGGYSIEKSFRLAKNVRFIENNFLKLKEYVSNTNSSDWYIGSDISLRILNFEIQQGPTFLPFLFFNRLFLTAGYRNAYLKEEYYHTAYSRINLVMPFLGGSGGLSSYKFNAYFEGYYAINDSKFGYSWGIDFSKQFDEK